MKSNIWCSMVFIFQNFNFQFAQYIFIWLYIIITVQSISTSIQYSTWICMYNCSYTCNNLQSIPMITLPKYYIPSVRLCVKISTYFYTGDFSSQSPLLIVITALFHFCQFQVKICCNLCDFYTGERRFLTAHAKKAHKKSQYAEAVGVAMDKRAYLCQVGTCL